MKKFLLIVGGFIVVVLLAAAILPFIYKDDIKAALDDAIAENVNAKVYFDESRFGLTLFKNFPNLTVTLGGLGVVGIDEFKKDTLAAVDQVDVVVNIMSVINGNYRISGLYLNEPNIYVKVLANGKANYDIAKPSEEAVAEETPTESGDVQFGIDKWEIKNGNIVYDDATIPFYMAMKGMNHTGSGDFTLEVFDMGTYT
ncbi:MAG: AsmA family protein, partial [Imperialibacter sp.]